LTGDQHTDHIATGQRVSRPDVFYFFSHRTFLKAILASPQVAHLVLPNTQANPSQNQKSHFLAKAILNLIS